MTRRRTLEHTAEAEVRELLLGRRVVRAVTTEAGYDQHRVWRDATGVLKLDDGTTLTVYPNSGCGGCPAGNYALTHLAKVDNVITSVTFDAEESAKGGTTYRVFVYAGHETINAVELLKVEGDDGNGHYGTGYSLVVSAP